MTMRSVCSAMLWLACTLAVAEGEVPRTIALADGALTITAPAAWKSVTPANRIIEHELAVPGADDNADSAARLTIMAAGGSVEANVARWVGQFKAADAAAGAVAAKTEKLDVNGMAATLVDLSGVYADSPRGPFGPKVDRPGYRLVGAIVETKGEGDFFFKLIGPEKTVAATAEEFRAMIGTLQKK